jgi:hypothetical protein
MSLESNSSNTEGSNTLSLDPETCVICLDALKEGETQTLPCQHIFHKDCLSHWESNSNLCPTCRSPIKHAVIALREALAALEHAANEVSISAIKLKTVTKQQVGHLPLAQEAARALDEMSSNIGQIAHLLAPPEPMYQSDTDAAEATQDLNRILQTLLGVADPTTPTFYISSSRARRPSNSRMDMSMLLGSLLRQLG